MILDESTKEMIGNILMSFIGCLLALVVIGIICIVVFFAVIEGVPELAKDIAVRELSSMSVECSEVYTKASLVLTLNGVAQYCVVSNRPTTDIDEFVVDINRIQ